jgi:hypothetical protein
VAGAGVAAVAAGAQGLGGPEEESGLWGGHWHPLGQVARSRLRQRQGEASGLQKKDKLVPSLRGLYHSVQSCGPDSLQNREALGQELCSRSQGHPNGTL